MIRGLIIVGLLALIGCVSPRRTAAEAEVRGVHAEITGKGTVGKRPCKCVYGHRYTRARTDDHTHVCPTDSSPIACAAVVVAEDLADKKKSRDRYRRLHVDLMGVDHCPHAEDPEDYAKESLPAIGTERYDGCNTCTYKGRDRFLGGGIWNCTALSCSSTSVDTHPLGEEVVKE